MQTKPRLAYLTALYPAVSHTFIEREIAGLRELGFDVSTCSIRRPGPEHLTGNEERAAATTTFYVVASARSAGFLARAVLLALRRPVRTISAARLAQRIAPPGVAGALRQLFFLAEAVLLARHLRDRRIDHLHNHFADPSANVALLAAHLAGIPFSYTLHGPAELYEPEKWHLREKTARARFVATISHFARSQAMYFSDPAHWEKIRIIHCGVHPERYAVQRTTPSPGLRLLFVGRLAPIKGVRVLMDAFEAASQVRDDVRLTIVGDGVDRAHLEARAANLAGRVRFAGYLGQSGVARAMAEADALILPSFAEGLPVVLMEAMASGLPVIATQVGGVNELVEDGVSGFLVPASDAPALTRRILDLASDPGARISMGTMGRARVAAEFDARQEAARVATLFVQGPGDELRPAQFSKAV